MELIRSFEPTEMAAALESWGWIGLGDKAARFASAFGDVFLEDAEGWWHLDVLDGTLASPWTTPEAMRAEFSTPEGAQRYLRSALASEVEARGIALGAGEVFDFVTPPVLGGSLSVDNLRATSFVVTVSLLGQIHDQVRRFPPGTRISGVSIG
jgi:Domain of unknown function (DUF1851)